MKAQDIKAGQTFYTEDGFTVVTEVAAEDAVVSEDGKWVHIECEGGYVDFEVDTDLDID